MPTITISIIEDDKEFANTLKNFLEDERNTKNLDYDFKVNSIFHTKNKFIDFLKENDGQIFSNIILIDIYLTESQDGIDLLIELKNYQIEAKLVTMTNYGNKNLSCDSIFNGANGHINKIDIKAFPSRIIEVIKDIAPERNVGDENEITKRNEPLHKLSKSEIEIIKLLFEGKSRKEISNELPLQYNTVAKHISNAYRKLEINKKKDKEKDRELKRKYDYRCVKDVYKLKFGLTTSN